MIATSAPRAFAALSVSKATADGSLPGGPRDHLAADPLAPDLQLLDGGRAKGVGRAQDHAAALGAVARGELADAWSSCRSRSRRAPGSRAALPRERETGRRFDAPQLLEDRLAQHAAHLVGVRTPRPAARTLASRLSAVFTPRSAPNSSSSSSSSSSASSRRPSTSCERRPTSASLVRRRRSRRRAGAGTATAPRPGPRSAGRRPAPRRPASGSGAWPHARSPARGAARSIRRRPRRRAGARRRRPRPTRTMRAARFAWGAEDNSSGPAAARLAGPSRRTPATPARRTAARGRRDAEARTDARHVRGLTRAPASRCSARWRC